MTTQTASQLRSSVDYHWARTRIALTAQREWEMLSAEQKQKEGSLSMLVNNCIDQVLATTPYAERNVGLAARPVTLAQVLHQDFESILAVIKEVVHE
jgi:hypothetical protein